MKDTILLVEDDKSLLDSTAELLELAGYNVITAENGKDGLVKARKYSPNLILCDIMLPELDGYGVLRAVENIPELAGVPFIFATGDHGRDNFRRVMDLGADDYLVKPIDGEELLQVVAARLNKTRQVKKIPGPPVSLNEAEIFAYSRLKKVRAKEFIYMEGDSANSIYYIKSGRIKIFKTNTLGKDYITGIFTDDDFFGYAILEESDCFTESAVALVDSEIGVIPKNTFFELLNANCGLSKKFIKLISRRLSAANAQSLSQAYNSVRKRVADALLMIYTKYDANGKGEFQINREDISALAGTSPESVSRTLTEFKTENLIEILHGNVKIIDNGDRLKRIKN